MVAVQGEMSWAAQLWGAAETLRETSGKTLHHDLDPPGALCISEAADEPRGGRKAYLTLRV